MADIIRSQSKTTAEIYRAKQQSQRKTKKKKEHEAADNLTCNMQEMINLNKCKANTWRQTNTTRLEFTFSDLVVFVINDPRNLLIDLTAGVKVAFYFTMSASWWRSAILHHKVQLMFQ